ncbi:cytochrome C oxidase copper chaperone-domain-containing protein [Entophlyctis helioformis]|nr:cytochrome C oxidase copper chaperone-domain-containing protein [Entophlyctis helioformis]
MGASQSTPFTQTQQPSLLSTPAAAPAAPAAAEPKCKPCCACPETRKVRDECVIVKGEEACADLIKAHQDCMRAMGFNI